MTRDPVSAAEAEAANGERLEAVVVHWPNGDTTLISREQVLAIDLAGGAVAWRSGDGKIHRLIGQSLETLHVESRIVTPM